MREIRISAEDLILKLLSLEPAAKLALLDSCGRIDCGARYLIAGIYPTETFEFYCETKAQTEKILQILEEKLAFYNSANNSFEKFNGACIATFAYDFGLLFENLSPRLKEFAAFKEPFATFGFYETLFVHDYKTGKTFTIGKSVAKFIEILKNIDNKIFSIEGSDNVRFESNLTKTEYLEAVEKIREHIASGDIYQANLTQQFRVELPENLQSEKIFLRLRENHPAPFAAFIRRDNDCVISISPERFLKVGGLESGVRSQKHKIVLAQPIKGTRRRGRDKFEDEILRKELETSFKDRAENIMIVDLLRNDIGRVCEFGSVTVEKLCALETHPTIFHLVSTISGELRENAKVSDLLKAAFPSGSITGAPKIRAMQILDEIETAPRGLSMGAIGYFSFDGELDLNVAIRTIVVRDKTAVFNVGGGITFDSEPEAEFEESLTKARALFAALGAKQ